MKFTDLSEESKTRAREALCSSLANSLIGSEEEAAFVGKAISVAFIAMESYDGAPDVCGDKATVTDSNGVECGRAGPDFHVVISTSAKLLEGKCSFPTT